MADDACGIGGDGVSDGGDVASVCCTLRLDPETRGAMPRAGLGRHALAARLAVAARAARAAAAAAAARHGEKQPEKLLEKNRPVPLQRVQDPCTALIVCTS